ncbi:MAG: SRPBCC family protein [Candidatus Bathyarchaeia archaeon]
MINSSAKRLWALITDFEDFPRWNPFIRRATGEIKTEQDSKYSFNLLELKA